jgi:hypothetical protein
MLQNHTGSPDGIQVLDYQAGQKYDLPERLAVVFLREGWAEEDKELAPPETKDAGTLRAEAKAAAKAAAKAEKAAARRGK